MKKITDIIAGCRKPASQLTPEEVFSSSTFQEYCRTSVAFVTGRFTNTPIVYIRGSEKGVAYTSGDTIVVNPFNEIATWYAKTEAQIMANLGILFHECAHILFLDFSKENRAIKEIENGHFFGDEPSPCSGFTSEESDKMSDFISEFESGKYGSVFSNIYHSLSNIISDPHDEEKICNVFHGIIEEAIGYSTDSLWNQQKMLEDYTVEETEKNKISIAFNMILSYARFGEIPCKSEESLKKSHFYPIMEKTMPYIDGARYTDDVEEKFSNLNMICFYLWDFIKEILKEEEEKKNSSQNNQQSNDNGNNSNSNNNTGSSNNGISQQQQGEIQQQLQQGAQSLSSSAPQNRKTVKNKPDCGNRTEKKEKEKHQKNDSGNKEVSTTVMESAANEIAENKADQDMQNADLVQVATCDQNSTHRNVSVHASRSTWEPDSSSAIIDPVKPISRRMQKQVLEVLRDLQEGTVTHHKLYGKTFNASDSYRPDGRFFSNKKQPLDVPDMAVSVLIDQSGSMRGERITGATKAAVMLYDFCDGLKVPCLVAGHSADGSGVNYTVYAGFNGLAKRDIRRICALPHNTGGCNRDGLALTISADGLAKRAEKEKLLFIICDGQPNHSGYGGDEAAKDIQSIVAKFRKLGVEIIACAIGDDKGNIQKIYGNGFLNISDLNTMPAQLVKMLRKRLVNY